MKKALKKLTVVFTTIIFSSISINTAAQTSGATRQHQGTLLAFQKIKKLLNYQNKDYSIDIKDIKGSPYLNNNFSLGKLYLSDSLIGTNLFRYNIYADEIEVTENDQLYGLLKINKTKLIIDNKEIILEEYQNNLNTKEKGYFILLSSGENLKLFLRKKCKLTPAQKATTPNQMDRTAKFTIYDEFYVKIKDEKLLKKIKIKEKAILKIMKDQKENIYNYINNNNLKLKNEENLTNLFNYYNSL